MSHICHTHVTFVSHLGHVYATTSVILNCFWTRTNDCKWLSDTGERKSGIIQSNGITMGRKAMRTFITNHQTNTHAHKHTSTSKTSNLTHTHTQSNKHTTNKHAQTNAIHQSHTHLQQENEEAVTSFITCDEEAVSM